MIRSEDQARQDGPFRLGEAIRTLRQRHSLTQEQLAVRATLLDPTSTVSVDSVRSFESRTRPRPLPRRRPTQGRLTVELILLALDADVPVVLRDCFSDEELKVSCFAWVLTQNDERQEEFRGVRRGKQLAEFIDSLPTDARSLLRLPGIQELRNAEAFAYIFALERAFSSYELSVLVEPPVIFLDDPSIERWGSAMGLSEIDLRTFLDYVTTYKIHSRQLLRSGEKRARLVLVKKTFTECLLAKQQEVARHIVQDIIVMLNTSPHLEIVILDLPRPGDEVEIISARSEIPSSLLDTVSIVIRQTSMSADVVEFSLVPMPPTFSSLQRDISRVQEYWSLALDQYRSLYPSEFWMVPKQGTLRDLQDLLHLLGD